MHDEQTIKVRYTSGTYIARISGLKSTASCTISPVDAARAMARKIGADPHSVRRIAGQTGEVFICRQSACDDSSELLQEADI
ncbi:hypothetical protein [Pseudomonas sp. UBA4194]|uniref:hypothetical protein n=1 Tax=Pseudomonas sp. UBA4194 TaxID=1947317 RepID=UPI0025D12729|nr:hypothetical protein [Pseudomonas sp. UBA4194]